MRVWINHLKYLKRCIFKLPKECKRYLNNRREFSAEVAKQLFIHAFREKPYSDQYITVMDSYVKKLLIQQTQEYIVKSKERHTSEEFEPIVWTCWWQGKEQMPAIVKACTARMKEVFRKAGIKCVIISKDNLQEFIELPEYILQKFTQKKIGLAHFADIIRWGLIAQYGGIWLDACDFLCKDDPEVYISYLKRSFYTQKFASPDLCPHEPCMGKWCNGYFMGQPHNLVAEYTYAGLLQYWKEQTAPFDYIFLDYIIRNGYHEIPGFAEIIDAVPANSEQFYSFRWKINDVFSEGEYRSVMEKSDFYNISYKLQLNKKNADGKETFYGHIISKYCDVI